jgi:hypothetical protein
MNKIEEAALRLLSKREINEQEYKLIKESAIKLFPAISYPAALTKYPYPVTPGAKTNWLATALSYAVPFAALLGSGVVAKEMIVDPLIQKSKIDQSYKLMQEKVPQLVEKDQNQIRDYFDVVQTYSPRAASNPLVAGALVNKMMEFGGVDHKLIQDISAIEANQATPTSEKLINATKSLGAGIKS